MYMYEDTSKGLWEMEFKLFLQQYFEIHENERVFKNLMENRLDNNICMHFYNKMNLLFNSISRELFKVSSYSARIGLLVFC